MTETKDKKMEAKETEESVIDMLIARILSEARRAEGDVFVEYYSHVALFTVEASGEKWTEDTKPQWEARIYLDAPGCVVALAYVATRMAGGRTPKFKSQGWIDEDGTERIVNWV